MSKLLSIVIISWNSRGYLAECLRSIDALLKRDDVELVWVDNGSTDGSAEMMAEIYPESKRVILPENRGVAYARNRGVEQSTGKYVLFLDDDTIASPQAILDMVAYMDEHPDVGICAPSLWSSDHVLQESFKDYPGLLVKVRNICNKFRGKERDATLPTAPIEPEYVIGACQLIRRQLFTNLGLLDEKIFYGPEDADFCIRVRRAGLKVVYLPHIEIIHHWRRITNRNFFTRMSAIHLRALIYFWGKHRRL